MRRHCLTSSMTSAAFSKKKTPWNTALRGCGAIGTSSCIGYCVQLVRSDTTSSSPECGTIGRTKRTSYFDEDGVVDRVKCSAALRFNSPIRSVAWLASTAMKTWGTALSRSASIE